MKKIITDINNQIFLKEENIKLRKINKYIENNVINVYKNEVINKYLGMGSAITGSTSYNYFKLSKEKRNSLLNDVYSKEGLNFNYGRISIGSCDFSLSSYSYSKKSDLSDFSIEKDKLIINMLNDIQNINKIDLIASPWSPPSFMKKIFSNKLKNKYYELYAKYLKLFIKEYNKMNIDIKYITMQNEVMTTQRWESCEYSLSEQRDFIYNYLIKELEDINTSVILWDHNRENIYDVANYFDLSNKKIKGIGFHWYSGKFYNNINLIHKKYPNTLLVNTEMCCGYSNYNEKEWINDAELYMKDIISCFNNGVSIYLDWNLLLDYNGGPNHKQNYCKSSIILNEEENDYIKTPIYYYIKHISKYINAGYQIITTDKYEDNLYVVSFKNNKEIVTVILNPSDEDYDFNLIMDNNYLKDSIKSHTVLTYII